MKQDAENALVWDKIHPNIIEFRHPMCGRSALYYLGYVNESGINRIWANKPDWQLGRADAEGDEQLKAN